ncbi:hypothetical protein E2C01_000906 [Portunus trituberculatus]|uniref:Uncharacterized protein n=1 Tax=Portunus trituberculatus TaxID=210409 RepID=A0A5B7CL62_PORTR|nr:hypothetical protein [Portunus trituberculatus]
MPVDTSLAIKLNPDKSEFSPYLQQHPALRKTVLGDRLEYQNKYCHGWTELRCYQPLFLTLCLAISLILKSSADVLSLLIVNLSHCQQIKGIKNGKILNTVELPAWTTDELVGKDSLHPCEAAYFSPESLQEDSAVFG